MRWTHQYTTSSTGQGIHLWNWKEARHVNETLQLERISRTAPGLRHGSQRNPQGRPKILTMLYQVSAKHWKEVEELMSVGGFAHGTVHVCRIGLHHCCGRILQAGAVSQDTILEVAICLHAIIFHCAIWLGSYGVTSLETMVRAFALADEYDEMARLLLCTGCSSLFKHSQSDAPSLQAKLFVMAKGRSRLHWIGELGRTSDHLNAPPREDHDY